MAPAHDRTIALFDVDGTLTVPRKARRRRELREGSQKKKARGARELAANAHPSLLLLPLFPRAQEASKKTLEFLQDLRKVRGRRPVVSGRGSAGPAFPGAAPRRPPPPPSRAGERAGGRLGALKRARGGKSAAVAPPPPNFTPPSSLSLPSPSQYVKVGIVGGSDLVKICEQLGPDSELTEGERERKGQGGARAGLSALALALASASASASTTTPRAATLSPSIRPPPPLLLLPQPSPPTTTSLPRTAWSPTRRATCWRWPP